MFTTRGTAFDKAIDNIFNNISEPIWNTEVLFGNPFNDTDLNENTLSIALPGSVSYTHLTLPTNREV